ncbi:hypothetical protein OH492_14070 [Vibrio chagasii]|nr:hypothetical protein [Vibrio chagasii]
MEVDSPHVKLRLAFKYIGYTSAFFHAQATVISPRIPGLPSGQP